MLKLLVKEQSTLLNIFNLFKRNHGKRTKENKEDNIKQMENFKRDRNYKEPNGCSGAEKYNN